MKLGKKAPRHDARTLKLATYLQSSLPKAPDVVQWSSKVKAWGLYLNDVVGDCAVASAANLIRCWSANGQNKEDDPPEWLVLTTYAFLSGYDPSDATTDVGLVELDVLKYWRQSGFGGYKIEAFAAVDPQRLDEVRAGIWLFGGLYVGLELPEAWETRSDVWDVGQGQAYQRGSWGGHAVPIVGYDARGVTIVTWGGTRLVTWAAWQKYGSEAWACIAPEFTNNGKAPNGFDLAALRQDLQALHAPA